MYMLNCFKKIRVQAENVSYSAHCNNATHIQQRQDH